ncbi:MAG: PGF-pre-PGF domain-containing protein [Candidatus Methanoperedens sp.]|nr:PGF-pre-PGF domain-containing protein [Candidatus Methanoperedens sp.]
MKTSYLNLSLIVLIILSTAVSAFAAPVEVSVTSDIQIGEVGQDFSINISIDPFNNPITGAQFNLLFDSSVLEIKSITEGNLFNQNGANTAFNSGILNNSDGTLINVWGLIITPGANVTTKANISTITMNAKNTGSSRLNLTHMIVSDPDSNALEVNIINGSVSINSGSVGSGGGSSGSASSGGGGGGGGAGGTSGEDFNNIQLKEKFDRFINKDIPTSYCFRNATNPIICINITANISPGEINTAVEVLRNTSSLVKDPAPDTVFKNVNIWVGTYGFATPTNIKHAEITFRVPVSWMRSNSIDPDSITMMHYQGAWEPLSTKKISETSEWIYYEASTTRFSPHAITGKISYGGSYNLIPQTTANTESQQMEKQVSNVGNEAESPGNLNKYLITGIFIGIVLNVTLIIWIRKPKKKMFSNPFRIHQDLF